MSTDLAEHVADIAVIDTHEHMCKEQKWLDDGPADVLQDLFNGYPTGDLISAGATPEAVKRLGQGKDADIEARWSGIADAWAAMQFTGYGEAVRLLAEHVYGIDEINARALADAQPRLDQLRRPGQRLALLRDTAKLDHIQTDDMSWPCPPDASGPEFFLYDLSWWSFSGRDLPFDQVAEATGIEVTNLATLRQAAEKLFELHAPTAVAVKTQHAYNRTLKWSPRSDADAERALDAMLVSRQAITSEVGLCLSDWCLARGVELATRYNLPIKIHTGYYAGNDRMPLDWIDPRNLCELLKSYPDARFVLMHGSYPFGAELIAMAKHYRNTWADLCWAWSIDPHSSMQFVRRFIHAAPINKLFGFGGDTHYPTAAYAYCLQMRKWLTRALSAEVDAGELSEAQAMEVASCIMRKNQLACFDLTQTRAAIRAAG
jgi:predicted TIM-barrel fold metal-dependent hydrolase